MAEYRLGIDLGGTSIKGGIIDKDGNVLYAKSTDTEAKKGAEYVMDKIAEHTQSIIASAGRTKTDFENIGFGSPGIVDDEKGIVVFAGNLGWQNIAIKKGLQDRLGIAVKIGNDANVAALGEIKYGAGAGLKSAILITLGTGVGGGIILDGQIYSGNGGAGAELGHMIIVADGNQCTCGQKGCFEAYSSAIALKNKIKQALQQNPHSQMWSSIQDIHNVHSSLAFDFYQTDTVAQNIVREYAHYLAIGLINFANIFRPQAIMLGGGISYLGTSLIKLIQDEFDNGIFGGASSQKVELRIASLQNNAGFIGAACL